jgi:NADPH:quinone reductase-like Zn-dependent oxidoreductase
LTSPSPHVATAPAAQAVRSARIVRLLGPRQIAWQHETLPLQAPAGGVLCETLVSAISPGTELAAYCGAPPLRDGPGYPRLQGYCNVARVLEVGAGVAGVAQLEAGDRILSFTSHRSHFVLSASDVLLRLDDRARAEDLACAYLFHLGYNAVLRADVRAGSRVLVLGIGTLGLAAVAMARAAGATVTAVSDHERARALALHLGAAQAVARTDLAPAPAADAGSDVVIVTTNTWADWRIALAAAAPRGTLAVLGFPGRTEAPGDYNPLDSRQFYAKQLRIEAVGMSPERPDPRGFARFNERDNLRWLAGEIGAGRLDASALVSGVFPAERIEDAYRALLDRRDAPVTYLLRWAS